MAGLSKFISNRRLAPFWRPVSDATKGATECPLCVQRFQTLNETLCCRQGSIHRVLRFDALNKRPSGWQAHATCVSVLPAAGGGCCVQKNV